MPPPAPIDRLSGILKRFRIRARLHYSGALAERAGMSRTAFANAFRERVGQTPADYLSSWRIALTQSRLREGRPIKILAEELGYANPSALSRAFSARVGMSPRDWLAKTLS